VVETMLAVVVGVIGERGACEGRLCPSVDSLSRTEGVVETGVCVERSGNGGGPDLGVWGAGEDRAMGVNCWAAAYWFDDTTIGCCGGWANCGCCGCSIRPAYGLISG